VQLTVAKGAAKKGVEGSLKAKNKIVEETWPRVLCVIGQPTGK